MKRTSAVSLRGGLALSASVALACTLGYLLTGFVFRFIGEPPALAANILSGLTGFYVVWCSIQIWLRIHLKRSLKNGVRQDRRMQMLEPVIEAMNRIAHGDFDVLIPVDEHDPFGQLSESINTMARELGSMESLRQDFISNVSHEIQSPLTSISGFAALLRNDGLTAQKRSHYLGIIETEARRLSKLSDNLLKLSSLEHTVQPLSIAAFPLNKQIENAVLMLEPQWSEKHLNLELELEKLLFSGDEALLSQVFINLIHNAVKFTPEHGEIKISLCREEDQICCRISDNGPGISPADQVHIFERFYKADKARDRSLGGNGLGLSLVRKITELHGGRVSVLSGPGEGTCFTVMLPVPIS